MFVIIICILLFFFLSAILLFLNFFSLFSISIFKFIYLIHHFYIHFLYVSRFPYVSDNQFIRPVCLSLHLFLFAASYTIPFLVLIIHRKSMMLARFIFISVGFPSIQPSTQAASQEIDASQFLPRRPCMGGWLLIRPSSRAGQELLNI